MSIVEIYWFWNNDDLKDCAVAGMTMVWHAHVQQLAYSRLRCRDGN